MHTSLINNKDVVKNLPNICNMGVNKEIDKFLEPINRLCHSIINQLMHIWIVFKNRSWEVSMGISNRPQPQ